MKNIIKFLFLFAITQTAFSQNKSNTYKQSFSGADKKVIIASGSSSLIIEGTNGSEVIIESDKSETEFPEEAAGLKVVTGGTVDNTGIGANVTIEGNTMKMKIPKSKYFGNFTVKVPKDMAISLRESGNSYGKWQINGMKGEVEAETSFSTLNINNASGPIVARGGYGKIYVVYDKLDQSKPNSISAAGAVDITLPADSKANLKLKTSYAEVFTDFDIVAMKKDEKANAKNEKNENKSFGFASSPDVFVIDKEAKSIKSNTKSYYNGNVENTTAHGVNMSFGNGKSSYSYATDDCDCEDNGTTSGTINGGGVSFSVKSDHGNIYLRKKK